MNATNIYLSFNGNCRQAMTFYGQVFGTSPGMTPYGKADPEMLTPAHKAAGAADFLIHSELHAQPLVVMACDVLPGAPFIAGTNFSISLACDSLAEMEKLFAALSAGGKVTLPMHDAFWGGRFGILTDQFNVSWMLSYRA